MKAAVAVDYLVDEIEGDVLALIANLDALRFVDDAEHSSSVAFLLARLAIHLDGGRTVEAPE